MSMAFVLEGVRDYLRTAASWDVNRCGIQHGAIPPAVAPEIYVAIDAATVGTSPENSEYLGETFEVTVGVWKRFKEVPQDFSGSMLVAVDVYRAAVDTLHSEERKVIKFLHHEWALLTAINTQFSLPDASKGDAFQSALHYLGNPGNETMVIPDGNSAAYLGRRLRFRGLLRIQYVESIG